jgi:polysaccharide deacetylase family protein (PEP-CTERM system associated)
VTNRVLHGWSVDVEDWFHILDCPGAPSAADWEHLPARVALGTERMLSLLQAHGLHGTFFVLGWVAERHPELIARIAAAGHEIGSHGHTHQLVSQQGPDAFARDLDASLQALTRATGRDVHAFRAPGFSITPNQHWAFPILASRGITLDASLFLTARAHGGYPLDRQGPFELQLGDGRRIVEVPTVPRRLLGRELAFSGGGYLRLLPDRLLEQSFADAERRGCPAVAYLHPRELDPGQPRMNLPLARRFKYYVGLSSVERKIRMLFTTFRFGTLSQVAADRPLGQPLDVSELGRGREAGR